MITQHIISLQQNSWLLFTHYINEINLKFEDFNPNKFLKNKNQSSIIELETLFIESNSRFKGFGSKHMEKFLSLEIVNNSIIFVLVNINPDEKPNVDNLKTFYEKFGFVDITSKIECNSNFYCMVLDNRRK